MDLGPLWRDHSDKYCGPGSVEYEPTYVERRSRSQSQPALPKPVIIGIYGLPGSGKSYILKQLQGRLDSDDSLFFEGSEVLNTVCSGVLRVFKNMSDERKAEYRQLAIGKIKEDCARVGKTGVVVGHFMFWSEKEVAVLLFALSKI